MSIRLAPANPPTTTDSSEPTAAPTERGLIFYGDPHGVWEPLLAACADAPPDGVVLLGDCDLRVPLREQIAPMFAAAIRVLWIPGNHDTDSPDAYDRLWGEHPCGNLHASAVEVGGVAVAGLGGVFKGRIWYPKSDAAAPPLHHSRADHLKRLARTTHWRGGLPLRLRDAIYPEDVDALASVRADVLVAHEAPSCHHNGFVGVDSAAHACAARLVVHGHHHHAYDGVIPSGARVRGLGRAEVFRLRRGDLS